MRRLLLREFRSNANTPDGMVHELPGGSSASRETTPLQVAVDELREETGLSLPASRFKMCGERQCMATMLTHQAHLFSIELTDDELQQCKSNEGKRFGENDSERTYIEVRTVGEILAAQDVDWTHIGMILSVLNKAQSP